MGREVTGRARGAPEAEVKGLIAPGFCPAVLLLLLLLLLTLLLLAPLETGGLTTPLFPSCCFKTPLAAPPMAAVALLEFSCRVGRETRGTLAASPAGALGRSFSGAADAPDAADPPGLAAAFGPAAVAAAALLLPEAAAAAAAAFFFRNSSSCVGMCGVK